MCYITCPTHTSILKCSMLLSDFFFKGCTLLYISQGSLTKAASYWYTDNSIWSRLFWNVPILCEVCHWKKRKILKDYQKFTKFIKELFHWTVNIYTVIKHNLYRMKDRIFRNTVHHFNYTDGVNCSTIKAVYFHLWFSEPKWQAKIMKNLLQVKQ